MTSVSGEVPVELLVRSQEYFEFLEPVSVEVRVRNLLPVPLTVSEPLHPEFGSVTIYIKRPDGRVVEFSPISCKIAPPRPFMLAPAGASDGSDRHSRTVFVSYGRYGFYFDEPGQYGVRAIYHGPGNVLVPSNVQRVRVGHPKNDNADRIAQDFFSYESGAALYLGGSHSRFLAPGMDTLLSMIEQQPATLAAGKTAARIARGVAQPFHDLGFEDDTEAVAQPVRQRATGGDSTLALHLTNVAIQCFRKNPSQAINIPMERVARTRAEVLRNQGDDREAHDEMKSLVKFLRAGGVKSQVVDKVERECATYAPPPRRPAARKRSKGK